MSILSSEQQIRCPLADFEVDVWAADYYSSVLAQPIQRELSKLTFIDEVEHKMRNMGFEMFLYHPAYSWVNEEDGFALIISTKVDGKKIVIHLKTK